MFIMNPFKKLLGQTAIYGLPSILGRFLNYCLVFLHTNIFVTSNYGVQNYFYAIAAFMAVVLTYGMETAYFRYTSLSDNKDRVFSTAQYSLYFTTIPHNPHYWGNPKKMLFVEQKQSTKLRLVWW